MRLAPRWQQILLLHSGIGGLPLRCHRRSRALHRPWLAAEAALEVGKPSHPRDGIEVPGAIERSAHSQEVVKRCDRHAESLAYRLAVGVPAQVVPSASGACGYGNDLKEASTGTSGDDLLGGRTRGKWLRPKFGKSRVKPSHVLVTPLRADVEPARNLVRPVEDARHGAYDDVVDPITFECSEHRPRVEGPLGGH